MRKLDIQISKAQLTGFSVELKEKRPNVTARIALLTEHGKHITDYSISTDAWQDDQKFELPVRLVPPIVDIMKQLEAIVVAHCMESAKQLPAPTIET